MEEQLVNLQQNHLHVKLVMCGTTASTLYLCKCFADKRVDPHTTNVFKLTDDELDSIKRILSGQISISP